MFNLSMPELLVILTIVMLVFGATRVPQLGRALGEAITGFREGMRGEGPSAPKGRPQPKSADDEA